MNPPSTPSTDAPTTRHLIDGAHVDSASGASFPTLDPATGDVLSLVAAGAPEDVDRAVSAARASFRAGTWSTAVSPADKVRVLLRLCDLIEQHADELAELEARDAGKPIVQARTVDVPLSAWYLRWAATWADKLSGETPRVSRPGAWAFTLREPVGVVAAIVPWNYPLMLSIWKLGPALAAGNSVVLKPAEQTPLSALRLGALALEAGVPDGVLNVVTGDGATGAALVRHPGVDKVSFTGSTAVGKEIMRSAADTVKRVSLELGGKSPHVIFADADVEAAAVDAVGAVFYNQGQDCTAGSRVLVQRPLLERVRELMAREAGTLRMGSTLDPATTFGPLISHEQRARVAGFVEEARSRSSAIEQVGTAPEEGSFYPPTLVGPVANDEPIAQQEVFGPVAALVPFDDEAEAIELANATSYGLASGVWTSSLDRALRMTRALRAGRVWINGYGGGDPAVPFGGYGASGFGRENGREVFDLYTETKSVWATVRDA